MRETLTDIVDLKHLHMRRRDGPWDRIPELRQSFEKVKKLMGGVHPSIEVIGTFMPRGVC